MRTVLVILSCAGALLGASGCCTVYKESLCKLSEGSAGVATHYEGYVASEQDASTKEARQAEAKQFRKTIDEAKQQCPK
jgi:hypothetical protein